MGSHPFGDQTRAARAFNAGTKPSPPVNSGERLPLPSRRWAVRRTRRKTPSGATGG